MTLKMYRRSSNLYVGPVYAIKEPMRLDFIGTTSTKSRSIVRIKEFANEVLCLGSHHILLVANGRPFDPMLKNVLKHFINCLSSKWSLTYKYLINYDSEAPPVDCKVVGTFLRQDLRSNIIRSSNYMPFLSTQITK
jgi:hypothetical protein